MDVARGVVGVREVKTQQVDIPPIPPSSGRVGFCPREAGDGNRAAWPLSVAETSSPIPMFPAHFPHPVLPNSPKPTPTR
jgi:hypothetical protein